MTNIQISKTHQRDLRKIKTQQSITEFKLKIEDVATELVGLHRWKNCDHVK
ncbi:hypothetical protein SBF1_1930015 [Candidatus Desulfosporosinus infrequens]|uniref:Uncharacterized protein n=1 Tax=Candidatus Desulfosporosinus infrequens TaxID=2043169 RepID=A0A2U3KG73_9FIRM|nr:hypothetical protein SBF1_1930015 [Candidatus Desulfosporosinus infrequens]